MRDRASRRAVWIVGSLTVLWVLAGCGADDPTPTPAPAAIESAAPGGAEVAVPLGIPEDLPRYPGAELVSFDNESYAEGLTATFETSDSAEDVGRYFDRELATAGWKVEVARHLEDIYVMFVNKDGVEVNIDVSRELDVTRIDLNIYGHEDEE